MVDSPYSLVCCRPPHGVPSHPSAKGNSSCSSWTPRLPYVLLPTTTLCDVQTKCQARVQPLFGTYEQGNLTRRDGTLTQTQGDTVREGFLYKTGKVRTAWKRRYFILKPQVLFYFDDQPSGTTEPLGVIELVGSTCSRAESTEIGQHRFDIATPSRVYRLYAITPDEMQEWMGTIKLCSDENFGTVALEEETVPAPAPTTDLPDLTRIKEEPELDSSPPPEQSLNVLDMEEPDEEDDGYSDKDSVGSRHSSFSDSSMTKSESKYFKKFGLTPPEQNKARQSVLLTNATGSLGTFPIAPAPAPAPAPTQLPSNDQIRNSRNYTSAGVTPGEKDRLLKQPTRRPPPREEPTCSCTLI